MKCELFVLQSIKSSLTMADTSSLVESLCHGCLSADRDLSPIGEFSDMFTMICQRKVRVPGMTVIYVCWECTATLKRIQMFNKQVNKAQNKLRLYIRTKETSLPKSLSKLNTSKTNHDFISLIEPDEPEPDIKPLDKIKEEFDHEENEDFEQEDDTNFSDANNEDEELKQDPTFIADLKEIKGKPQKQREKRYCRIRTAEEMCAKEQARQSDLVNLWERNRCIAHGSEASEILENIDYLKEECSKNENIETHNINNHNEPEHKPHVCNICHACYRTLEELESHVTSHETVYRCLVCGHRSPSMAAAGRHVTRHGEIVKCSLCEYCCRNYKDFRAHYKIAHVQFLCDYCGKKFTSKRKLEIHISVHHMVDRFKCKKCQRTFNSKRNLLAHIEYAHDVCETEETFCVECNVQFKNRKRFKAHLKNSSAHATQVGKPRKKEHIKCLDPECDKTYVQRSKMMCHYNYVHLGQTRYYCSTCDKRFFTSSKYDNHRRYTHEGLQRTRDKICSVCGRGFSVNKILINHMRTHTGERPFACAVCDARFAQKIARDVHQKRHSRNTN